MCADFGSVPFCVSNIHWNKRARNVFLGGTFVTTDGEVYLMYCLKFIINLSSFDQLKTKPDRMHCICIFFVVVGINVMFCCILGDRLSIAVNVDFWEVQYRVIVDDQRNTLLHRDLLKPTPDLPLSCPVMLVITQSCLLLSKALRLHVIMSLSKVHAEKINTHFHTYL